ncbi:hypothetical protein [Flavobacterium sp. UBA7663]|uniref:hypothetical protein n=1 Tax=Flavobacterium sp. UBA7663 TaxID=1946557 RepID=UPI0025BF92FB|nr:hypothetical protein [Flavobacterium sp. UBA7663]
MKIIKKYKLRILSILSLLFLFLPFVKQCEMNDNAPEETEFVERFVEVNKMEIIYDSLSDLEFYFTEESESVIDLCFQSRFIFESESPKKAFNFMEFLIISSIFLSIFLVIFSFLGVFLIFLSRDRFLSKLYLLNTFFVVLILFANCYVFIDRIGQIKIGFYLLLITNFYLFRHFRKLKIDK